MAIIRPKKRKWIESWGIPIAIPITGIIVTLIMGYFQISSIEKINLNDREMKMFELLSKDFLNINYNEEVWKTEGLVRLLGAMINSKSPEDARLQKLVRAVFEESITTTIGQFHRTETIRISAARVIASMYHLDKKFVIEKLIDEIKPEGYPGYFRINGAIVVTLAKIPDYWEGTKRQYERVDSLKYHKFLGEKNLTAEYKNGWLINEALKKWKQKN